MAELGGEIMPHFRSMTSDSPGPGSGEPFLVTQVVCGNLARLVIMTCGEAIELERTARPGGGTDVSAALNFTDRSETQWPTPGHTHNQVDHLFSLVASLASAPDSGASESEESDSFMAECP